MDLVRPLGLAGIRCVVAARPGAPPRFSRFTAARLEWSDPWRHPDVLAGTLLAFGAAQPEPPVLFYEEDGDLLFISRWRETLARAFRFVVPDATLVEDLVDKERFQQLAATLNLPVPGARRLDPATEGPGELGLRPLDDGRSPPQLLELHSQRARRHVRVPEVSLIERRHGPRGDAQRTGRVMTAPQQLL